MTFFPFGYGDDEASDPLTKEGLVRAMAELEAVLTRAFSRALPREAHRPPARFLGLQRRGDFIPRAGR